MGAMHSQMRGVCLGGGLGDVFELIGAFPPHLPSFPLSILLYCSIILIDMVVELSFIDQYAIVTFIFNQLIPGAQH